MEGFSEQLVKQKMTKTRQIMKVATLSAIILVVCVGFYLSMFPGLDWVVPIVLLLIVAAVYLIYNLVKNSGIEYEYTCVGGELRVDRIKGGRKRKVITRADVKSIEVMGKYNEMDKTKVDPSEYGIIYKAGDNLGTDDTYYAIIHDKIKHRPALLYFTPNEKTLNMMRPHLSVQLKKQLFLDKKSKTDKQTN
ncbi:MAG: DUF6106 family protein [Acutalibacteraceae bacterium]